MPEEAKIKYDEETDDFYTWKPAGQTVEMVKPSKFTLGQRKWKKISWTNVYKW